MSSWNLRTCLSVAVSAIVLSACSGGDSTPEGTSKGINGTYLYVTHREQPMGEDTGEGLYYADQRVGTDSSLAVRIANRGADIYPLKNLAIVGANADQFSVDVLDEIILNPAEAVTLDVVFRPTTEGNNAAEFIIDYDTIQMVEESVNINEQSYYRASELEASGEFVSARSTYNNYLQNDPVTPNKRRAAIRLPIIDESQTYDGAEDLALYLEAMRHRDEKDYSAAMRTLDIFTAMYPDSYLADDAYYLKGYIHLIDLDSPTNALRAMQTLRERFPDTSYYETSMYSDAIAQLEIGNLLVAKEILTELKKRHTGIDTLGIQLPKDNLISRMWFERANQMLETV
ncbi:MAG: hypothetical protein AB8B97_18735 [Granulosicoccus sp.]